ncbi:MAG: hypothetical protein NTZ74_09745 [Chloroflexi bacterium]|nr:hypothetical protein [Chloroflexota bacterium]
MGKNFAAIVILAVLSSLLLSSCGAGQAFGPTITATQISTNTPLPTSTNTPTPEPTATMIPLPTATFHVGEMSNPALEVVDVQVTVEGDLVTATFFLKDVPTEMEFQRKGLPQDMLEYEWVISIDTDNNMNTGPSNSNFTGKDYELSASDTISQFSNPMYQTGISNKGSQPLEKGIQMVYVGKCEKEYCYYLSPATITVDTVHDTIVLSGTIPGITENSKFYFQTFEYHPGGEMERSRGDSIENVTIGVTLTQLGMLPTNLP